MASGSGDDWCTIESDPGVFTEVLEEIGCTNVELEELWTLDDDSLIRLIDESGDQIYGLIFLFQYNAPPQQQQQQQTTKRKRTCLAEHEIPNGLFFAHQVTTNACATQAILSVVLNTPKNNNKDKDKDKDNNKNNNDESSASIELGTTLNEFRDFTESFPPSLKGVAISSSEPIKKAHNSFGRTDAFLNDGKFYSRHLRDQEDVFHFIAYIPFVDPITSTTTIYELDGLQPGPIVIGTVPSSKSNNDKDKSSSSSSSSSYSWLSIARTAIQERMNDGGNHVKFNLMAVLQDKRIALQNKLNSKLSQDTNNNSKNESTTTASNGEHHNNNNSSEISTIQYQLEMEQMKRNKWKLENQRRRHNYVPLCVSILQELANLKSTKDNNTNNNNNNNNNGNQLKQFIQLAKEKKQRDYQKKLQQKN